MDGADVGEEWTGGFCFKGKAMSECEIAWPRFEPAQSYSSSVHILLSLDMHTCI